MGTRKGAERDGVEGHLSPARQLTPFAKLMLGADDRDDAPRILYLAWLRNEIDDSQLSDWILHVWRLAEWPGSLGQRAWLQMFKAVGFIYEGLELGVGSSLDPCVTDGQVTVYRGAAQNRMRGFSWTVDPDRARWFADRSAGAGFPALVFAVTVPVSHVLAALGVEGRSEGEIILNPNRLHGRFTPHVIDSDARPRAFG